MANNRMSLVNTATGQRVLLATHLATAWRALAGIEDKLDQAFAAEHAEFPTAWGSTAWRVEYETDEPALDEELRRTVEDAEVERLRERAENAEMTLRAPEIHWECQQKIDALETECKRMKTVYEAAKAWRAWHGNKSQRHRDEEDDLEDAIDTALVAESMDKP